MKLFEFREDSDRDLIAAQTVEDAENFVLEEGFFNTPEDYEVKEIPESEWADIVITITDEDAGDGSTFSTTAQKEMPSDRQTYPELICTNVSDEGYDTDFCR